MNIEKDDKKRLEEERVKRLKAYRDKLQEKATHDRLKAYDDKLNNKEN